MSPLGDLAVENEPVKKARTANGHG
jgi:hypothetical protein